MKKTDLKYTIRVWNSKKIKHDTKVVNYPFRVINNYVNIDLQKFEELDFQTYPATEARRKWTKDGHLVLFVNKINDQLYVRGFRYGYYVFNHYGESKINHLVDDSNYVLIAKVTPDLRKDGVVLEQRRENYLIRRDRNANYGARYLRNKYKDYLQSKVFTKEVIQEVLDVINTKLVKVENKLTNLLLTKPADHKPYELRSAYKWLLEYKTKLLTEDWNAEYSWKIDEFNSIRNNVIAL